MREGLVSVIMPVYNSEAFVEDAIKSVLSQTYAKWELLMVDDASKDSSFVLLDKYRNSEPRIKIFRNSRNMGTAYSRNKAIEASQGQFIAFLDADDMWKDNKLELQLAVLSRPHVSACFSSYQLMHETGKPIPTIIEALPVLSYERLLKANYVGNLTGIYNAGLLGKIYAPDLRKRQDWALWLRVIEEGGPMDGIKESLAYYRVRQHSISGNKLEMLRYNYRIYRLNGFGRYRSFTKMMVFLNEQFFVKSKLKYTMEPEK